MPAQASVSTPPAGNLSIRVIYIYALLKDTYTKHITDGRTCNSISKLTTLMHKKHIHACKHINVYMNVLTLIVDIVIYTSFPSPV